MNKPLHDAMLVLTADKKKAAILASLAFVALGLWVRAAFLTGPAHADAAPAATASNATSDHHPGSTKQSKGDGAEDAGRAIVTIPPVKKLTRDLFALSDSLLALSTQTDQDPSNDRKSAHGIDDKSNQSRPESAVARRTRIRDEAGQLYLRSTMTGSNPVAVIAQGAEKQGGVVVRLGDEIAGFTLVAVRALEVEMEKEGVRVKITRDPS